MELQKSYSSISLQAAPWSAAIQAEVAASEAKATGALAEVRALHDATKAEVEDLRLGIEVEEAEVEVIGVEEEEAGVIGKVEVIERRRVRNP